MATVVGSTTAYAPPPHTFASLKRFVVDYVQGHDDAELLDVAGREINNAIERINSRNWKRISAFQDISMVADTSDYDLNTDVKAPIHVERLNSSSEPDGRMHYKEQKTFLIEHPVATESGTPNVYSIFHSTRKLVLQYPCSSSFVASYPTLRLHYYQRVPILTHDSDYHGAPPEFNAWLGWYARAGMASVRDEITKAQFARLEAERIWRDLLADDYDSMTDWDD